MNRLNQAVLHSTLNAVRRYLVGPGQPWTFQSPSPDWRPPHLTTTSLYLHVPFCRNCCPYCPYTKVPYAEALIPSFTRAALAEVDKWADMVGPADITSVYIGGGTPTVALPSVAAIMQRVRDRFHLCGDICIETNPTDVTTDVVQQLQDIGVALVSLGVESFKTQHLATLGRRYTPLAAAKALEMLLAGGFATVNADIMFALPGQSSADVLVDLEQAASLGADQMTTYPLFTFPYTTVGEHLRLSAVRMPHLRTRRAQYKAIGDWCAAHGFERVSVWGFKRGAAPRYSSVTRGGYIGIGPGAGSHLPDGFTLNTFDLADWQAAAAAGRSAIALRLPFTENMSGWWWLYWRLYDTRVPLSEIEVMMAGAAPKAHRLLKMIEKAGFAVRNGNLLELTEPGAFWLHLVQNHFALNYVNTLWTVAQREAWPERIAI